MSQQHLEHVRAMLALWNAGERRLDEVPSHVGPDVELESPFSSVVGVPYCGYSGIEQWMRDIDEQFAEWSIVPDELSDLGERLLAISTVTFRARASEFSSRFEAACLFDFDADGRVGRMRIYLDLGEARRDAGLAG